MKLSMFLGDKKFYRYVIGIALPIMLQNAINTFVNLLDNIMIGNVGAAQLSAVAISNQLIFVFNLCDVFPLHIPFSFDSIPIGIILTDAVLDDQRIGNQLAVFFDMNVAKTA